MVEALRLGYRLIDTAQAYENEALPLHWSAARGGTGVALGRP